VTVYTVEVEAVEGDKVHLASGDSVVLAWTWMRTWARRRALSCSLEAAWERGRNGDQISDGFKTDERDAYHDLDLLSWTGDDIVSAPGTETRAVVIVIGASTIALLAT
jgi:hypothetical protein